VFLNDAESIGPRKILNLKLAIIIRTFKIKKLHQIRTKLELWDFQERKKQLKNFLKIKHTKNKFKTRKEESR
jgi:hypothetical protein